MSGATTGSGLDAAAIADAAIALADVHGVDVVSMRRVGAELGVSGMALYRHVADRDDLVRRMVGRVAQLLPHLPVRDDDAHWREMLEHMARTEWTAFERHPWLADVVAAPTRLVDATSAVQSEAVLGRLVEAGLPPERAADVFVGVAALVLGIARVTLQADAGRRTDYAADDSDPDAAAGPGPLAAAFRAAPLDAARGRRMLETSLAALLDGVAASLTPRPGDEAAPASRAHDAHHRKEHP